VQDQVECFQVFLVGIDQAAGLPLDRFGQSIEQF